MQHVNTQNLNTIPMLRRGAENANFVPEMNDANFLIEFNNADCVLETNDMTFITESRLIRIRRKYTFFKRTKNSLNLGI